MRNLLQTTLVPQIVQNILNRDQAISDEGTYFVATNPTPSTGIATTTSVVDDAVTASSTHAQYSPTMIITNGYVAGSVAPNIYPISLRLINTAAPTSATIWNLAIRIDTIQRYVSGGSLILPVNPNTASGGNSRALIYFGALVSSVPSGNSKLVSRSVINPTIPIAGDQIFIVFGAPASDGVLVNATSVNKNTIASAPPIVLAPGCTMQIEMWGASNAGAPAWEFQLDYLER